LDKRWHCGDFLVPSEGIDSLILDSKDLTWGRLKNDSQHVKFPFWRDEISEIVSNRDDRPLLAGGAGRSYGDSGLNSNGFLVKMLGLNRLVEFDPQNGVLCCEAGATFAEILEFIVPKGWFLPVTPGTMFVTVGGAIANDVHGKNHHVAGTFGCFVEEMEVLSSSGEATICSQQKNFELFRATIGGLGLTGIITWARFKLKKIQSAMITQCATKFSNIDEFLKLDAASNIEHDYTVAWIDSSASGRNLGRGISFRGNHAPAGPTGLQLSKSKIPLLTVPFVAPGLLLNRLTMKAFNYCYYHQQQQKVAHSIIRYQPFFYPLDGVKNWNRLYGPRGFYQFQCVLPEGNSVGLRNILKLASGSGMSSFLTVLKKFGSIRSPGMLSFPISGYTLAFDFRNLGVRSADLIRSLSDIVRHCGGRIYPAKDALMSAADFKAGYPDWKVFSKHIDPGFSSNFWERVV
jgi:FAD/FMN-containing dehydrogenase